MKNLTKKISTFLEDDEVEIENFVKIKAGTKKIKEKDGLYERIDKKLITEDGRQLLTEYY